MALPRRLTRVRRVDSREDHDWDLLAPDGFAGLGQGLVISDGQGHLGDAVGARRYYRDRIHGWMRARLAGQPRL